MADQYDLLVIGAGPGGYVAAIRGAQLGMKVGIIEREHMAGICSNWGCIPTKALLRSAEIYGHMSHAKDYGLTAADYGFDLDAVVKRSRGIAAQMNNGVQFLMKKNKVDIIWGEAVITKPGEVKVAPLSPAKCGWWLFTCISKPRCVGQPVSTQAVWKYTPELAPLCVNTSNSASKSVNCACWTGPT